MIFLAEHGRRGADGTFTASGAGNAGGYAPEELFSDRLPEGWQQYMQERGLEARHILLMESVWKADPLSYPGVRQILLASLNSEPLFLTARGVYALTPSDVTGERYAQERSWYIGAALTREQAMEKACATVWGRFYVLAVNGTLYLLDGAQKSYESKNPYSTYQYEAKPRLRRCSMRRMTAALW